MVARQLPSPTLKQVEPVDIKSESFAGETFNSKIESAIIQSFMDLHCHRSKGTADGSVVRPDSLPDVTIETLNSHIRVLSKMSLD